jgi:hypothetical protein
MVALDFVQLLQAQEFSTQAAVAVGLVQTHLALPLVVLEVAAVAVMAVEILIKTEIRVLLTRVEAEAEPNLKVLLLALVALELLSFVTPHLYYHLLPQQEALR